MSLNIFHPISVGAFEPLCKMKFHCSYIKFKSSYVTYFLLIQIVELKGEKEREGGMETYSEFQCSKVHSVQDTILQYGSLSLLHYF